MATNWVDLTPRWTPLAVFLQSCQGPLGCQLRATHRGSHRPKVRHELTVGDGSYIMCPWTQEGLSRASTFPKGARLGRSSGLRVEDGTVAPLA